VDWVAILIERDDWRKELSFWNFFKWYAFVIEPPESVDWISPICGKGKSKPATNVVVHGETCWTFILDDRQHARDIFESSCAKAT